MKNSGGVFLGTGCVASFLMILAILYSGKANALGQTEEGILYGLGIYKIYDVLTEEEPWEAGQTGEYVSGFPPFNCKGDAIHCAYQRGVYEREREEWEDRREKAYECGRYGRNCDQ
jgi:hypothetical protein